MKSSLQEILPLIGTSMDGGFYGGRIMIDGQAFALIVAPKVEGEHAGMAWNSSTKMVQGAMSYCDGLTNTAAMDKGGSKLAKWVRGLRIADRDDWYLPSQDELEIIYRNLKSTSEGNTGWARSGINLSAIPPTLPYLPMDPAQTRAEHFQEGGGEAFDPAWYWSSTQYASDGAYAWSQSFTNGTQGDLPKSHQFGARAVRRSPI